MKKRQLRALRIHTYCIGSTVATACTCIVEEKPYLLRKPLGGAKSLSFIKPGSEELQMTEELASWL